MSPDPTITPSVRRGPGAPLCFLNGLRALRERAARIDQPYWATAALVHAASVARDLAYVAARHPQLTVPQPMGWFAETTRCIHHLAGTNWLLKQLADAFLREGRSPSKWTAAYVDLWAQALAGAVQHGQPGWTAVAHLALGHAATNLLEDLRDHASRAGNTALSALLTRGVLVERASHGLSRPRVRFVPHLGDPASVARQFRPSVAMVAALAEVGGFDVGCRVAAELPPRHRPRAMAWMAIGAHRRGHSKRFTTYLAQVPGPRRSDFVLGLLAVDAARASDFDEADRWLRAIQGAPVRAATAARVGLEIDADWAPKRARRYLRQALSASHVAPEAWALEARLAALRCPDDAPASIARAVATLKQRRRVRRGAPEAVPPLRPEPSSAAVVLSETLELWQRTRLSRMLDPIDGGWAGELTARPGLLDPLLSDTSERSVRRLVSALPQRLQPMLGAALEARAISVEAKRLDAGKALASIRSDRHADTESMTVLGALLGPSWSGRPAGGPMRVAFDEGASLAPGSRATRRLLATSARRWVRDGMASAVSADDLQRALAGIRILTNLGGTREKDLIAGWLERATRGDLANALMDGLVTIAPKRAMVAMWRRFWVVSDGGASASTRFRALEARGAVETGFCHAWENAHLRLTALGVADPARWWDVFAGMWWNRHGRPLPAVGLRLLADLQEGDERPVAAFNRLMRGGRALRSRDPERVVRALAGSEEELIRRLCLSQAAISVGVNDLDWWKELLTDAQRVPGVDDHRVSQMAAPLLAVRPRNAMWRVPRLGFSEPVKVGRHTLRLLDERRDALTYLTLADGAPCCLSVGGRPLGWQTRRLAALWRDPLSIAFQLEREVGGQRLASGFVFGSLGWSGKRPVVLLNGIYLRRSSRALRFDILAAIEEHWARPLGLDGIGIAAIHGGTGPLPPDYERCDVLVRRACGLKGSVDLYDDLTVRTREPVVVRHLFWKVWGSIERVDPGTGS